MQESKVMKFLTLILLLSFCSITNGQVYRFEQEGIKGSAVLIHKTTTQSYLLSCAHEVDKDKPVIIHSSLGKLKGRYLSHSIDDDLSIIFLQKSLKANPIPLADYELTQSQQVTIVGLNSGITKTTISQDTRFLEAPTKQGDSGGAVVDKNNRLVGIVVGVTKVDRDEPKPRGFMVRNTTIFGFIRRNNCPNGYCQQRPSYLPQEAPPPPEYVSDIPDVDKVRRIASLEAQIRVLTDRIEKLDKSYTESLEALRERPSTLGTDGSNGKDGENGKDAAPFTVQFYSKSKVSDKEFELGELRVDKSGIYRVELPDVIVEWLNPSDGKTISKSAFPAGTPVRLMLTKEVLEAASGK